MRWILFWITIILAAGATMGILLVQQSVTQRKLEAKTAVFKLAPIDETTVDAKEWGKNYPRQYDSFIRTVDTERTRYGGSEAFQRLDEDPVWRVIFAGNAFALDYREDRGHYYTLSDQRETERSTKRPQPGACLHCHASNVVAYREAGIKAGAPGTLTEALTSEHGQAQLFKGFETLCAVPLDEATKLVEHPVSCIDCHDPVTMHLRVSKPGFIQGIRDLAKSDDPLPHLPSVERWRKGDRKEEYDANTMASRQEMRSLSCAQCHVEYYFKGPEKLVTFPWHKGLKVEQMEEYYNQVGFADWKHAIAQTPSLKAQHPEFELWSQGIHARAGVACADCHMPYMRDGAMKVSSHHVRSPLLNIAQSCQVCHPYSESEIKSRVETIQDRTKTLMIRAEEATLATITAIEAAAKAGATDDALKDAREMHRKAQWRLDFIAAENSMGFHAPQEAARILGEAIDYARQGELLAVKLAPASASGAK